MMTDATNFSDFRNSVGVYQIDYQIKIMTLLIKHFPELNKSYNNTSIKYALLVLKIPLVCNSQASSSTSAVAMFLLAL